MEIALKGSAIGVDKNFSEKVSVPSLKDFSVTSTRVNTSGNKSISIFFSDPLDANQDLAGLIELQGDDNPRFVVQENEIRIFPSKILSGYRQIVVHEGVKNVLGYAFNNKESRTVSL